MISRRGLIGAALAAACSKAPAWAQTPNAVPRTLHARVTAVNSAGPATRLGYDGLVPGPVLRAKQGEELHVRLVNELTDPTAVHWHGVRLPNLMDGASGLTQASVGSGASFDYRFRPPDAGTFFYHAHSPHQSDAGLYGTLIVEEREPADVDRDIVLLLGIAQPEDLTLVNGAPRPDIPIRPGERVRLRLVNATGTRGLCLKIQDHAPWIMAIDGQPIEPFCPTKVAWGLPPATASTWSSMPQRLLARVLRF